MSWPGDDQDPDLPDGIVRFPPEPGRRARRLWAAVALLCLVALILLALAVS